MEEFKRLFTPLHVGGMTVKNRIFMAPISTHMADTQGRLTEDELRYYEARAKGGVGYITVASVLIEKLSRYGTYRNLGLYEDWHIENLRAADSAGPPVRHKDRRAAASSGRGRAVRL